MAERLLTGKAKANPVLNIERLKTTVQGDVYLSRIKNDLTGRRFGRLYVLERAPNRKTVVMYRCLCDCGAIVDVPYQRLNEGLTRSCGCLRRETARTTRLTHGDTGTGLYRSWYHMRDRCNNPSDRDYRYYGGRGIQVDPAWETYESFREWALSNGWSSGLTIDRIDNDGNYEPSNCRWITANENMRKMAVEKHSREKGRYYAISPAGDRYEFDNAAQFAREHDLNTSCISAVITGKHHHHKQWTFGLLPA